MKYTVTIQQPVQEERRRGLEQQLTERFNLNAEQAARLAGRRTGRLMKPTSRSRAELLLDVFQLGGAAVALEEVPEETRMMQEPFQGLAPSAAASAFGRSEAPDEAFLAPLQPAPAWPAPMEEASAEPVSVAVPSSFGAPPVAFTSGGAALSGGGSAVAVPTAVAATADPFAGPPADVWSDFTGSLTMTDAVPAVPAGGVDQPSTAVVPVVIPAVTADAGPTLPRRSLTRLLALNTLAPLALSSVAALGLLTLTLPAVQRQAAQSQAQTLAAAVGAGLGGGAQPNSQQPSSPQLSGQQLGAQLGAVVATPGVAFVRAELPGGPAILRAQDADVGRQSRELSAWLGRHPKGGTLKLGGSEFMVAQAVFRTTAAGKAELLPAGAATDAGVLRRVAVGVPAAQAGSVLTTALLLVLLAALLGLFLASLLTRRSARQITGPIDRLVKAADAISMGDLSRPVQAHQNDEIGDLAQALERMRQSLEAAMERLRRRRKG